MSRGARHKVVAEQSFRDVMTDTEHSDAPVTSTSPLVVAMTVRYVMSMGAVITL
jgi:hypothetical protein